MYLNAIEERPKDKKIDYLKSIKVRPIDKEVEFSYPKRIDKCKIEFKAIKVDGLDYSDTFVSDNEGRIALDKAKFKMNNRTFKIKGIGQQVEGKDDYFFYIEVREIVGSSDRLISMKEYDLSPEDTDKIRKAFTESTQERLERYNNISQLKVYFWNSRYKDCSEEEFMKSTVCSSVEQLNKSEKECWERESYLTDDSLRTLLKHAVEKRYGLSGLFDLTIGEVIRNSKNHTIKTQTIMSAMKEQNNAKCEFALDFIVK